MRIAPLLTTTATLHYAWDEHYFLSIFLSKLLQSPKPSITGSETKIKAITPQPSINSFIPRYFAGFFSGTGGLVFLLGTNAITIVTAGLNLHRRPFPSDPTRWYLYAGGLVFTLAHFWCMPLVMWRVNALLEMAHETEKTEGVDGGEASRELWGWLKGHYIRTFLTDIPGWLCFLGAVIV